MSHIAKFAAAGVLALGATSAKAAEFITNGGFENAAPTTGWTFNGYNIDTNPANAASGNNAASSTCFDATCATSSDPGFKSISQFVNLTPGNYTFSFAFNPGPGNDPSPTSGFNVYYDGTLLLSASNVGPNVYGTYSKDFTATGGGLLSFAGFANNGNAHGDNFSIQNVAGPGVPEPSGWALMIAGFGLTGAALRRSTSAARVTAAAKNQLNAG
ncbi:MAG: PEPxxWA-CTERM sorting domain-containing protein [Alphaproteobacteria bacterium]